MTDVSGAIGAQLRSIEAAHAVIVLHAVESGSRAWGFASPDSDYDVRFVYQRPVEQYLRLDATRDVIELMLEPSDGSTDVLDLSGWDLAKMLRLLHDSNPVIFEWDQSPIVYGTSDQWARIHAVMPDYFSQKKALHHYLSMASRNIKGYLGGETVRLKKYFYVLRPLLAAQWVLHRASPPPMLFAELTDSELPTSLREPVTQLLAAKAVTSEIGDGPHIAAIDQFVSQTVNRLDAEAQALAPKPTPGWAPLNDLFISLIK